MAAPIIGRTDCPECAFKSAHVKQSEKCLFRYCPDCGASYHTRTQRQRDDLMAKTRAASDAVHKPTAIAAAAREAVATPTPTAPEAVPTPNDTPPSPPTPTARRRLFS